QRVEYLFGLFTRKMLSFIDSINVTPGPLSVFRKSIFDALGGYQVGNISEDQEMALRIQENKYKIACSLEADVFTAVPSSLPELVKQRVRWYRGGLRNFFKYTHLISPKYGDFGVLMMPLAIISTIALFLVLGLSAHTFLTKSQSFSPSLEDFLLGLTPFSVLSLLVMLSTVAWTLMGLRQLHRESLPLDHLILYLVLYAPLVTLFWLATAFREITKSSLKWS
ncbi:MAG TPA: glycosyltransferase family 2 protein, partial [Candidatus Norongarragalinales archaeon]|nr:glycosyltransferase family 2 protein [Candidatus Norongarragalinales archaeon]